MSGELSIWPRSCLCVYVRITIGGSVVQVYRPTGEFPNMP